jgi:hypothetical protein
MSADPATQFQRLVSVAPQRWLLGALAVAAGGGASIVTGVSGGGLPPLLLFVIGMLAVLSAVRPDTHTALVVVALVVWQWLVVVDDPIGPAVVVVASMLLVFHSTIAVMAAAPATAHLDPAILRSWLRRTAMVGAATVATWTLVLLMDQRRASGSTLVTLAGFVTALVLAAVLRTSPRSREPVRD